MGYLEDRMKRKNGLLPKMEFKKQKKPLKKISPKRMEENKVKKESGGDSELDLFFNAMRKKCKGMCFFCQQGTTYKNDTLWRIAIAHLLPKSKFKSVATNQENWVELCWNCHHDFDNSKISWELLYDSKEWISLKEKLLNILPMVSENEKKNKLYDKLIKLVYGNHVDN